MADVILAVLLGIVGVYGWVKIDALTARADSHAEVLARLLREKEDAGLSKQSLTEPPIRAQNTPKRYSGAQLRRLAARENLPVRELTQAERLENNG